MDEPLRLLVERYLISYSILNYDLDFCSILTKLQGDDMSEGARVNIENKALLHVHNPCLPGKSFVTPILNKSCIFFFNNTLRVVVIHARFQKS